MDSGVSVRGLIRGSLGHLDFGRVCCVGHVAVAGLRVLTSSIGCCFVEVVSGNEHAILVMIVLTLHRVVPRETKRMALQPSDMILLKRIC